ncbi:hypothetical protein KY342_01565 [Candidatus Woesearchaeota archaeon]|nr:hypothetical protein [Candidatus Woesearchaeota archaeon]
MEKQEFKYRDFKGVLRRLRGDKYKPFNPRYLIVDVKEQSKKLGYNPPQWLVRKYIKNAEAHQLILPEEDPDFYVLERLFPTGGKPGKDLYQISDEMKLSIEDFIDCYKFFIPNEIKTFIAANSLKDKIDSSEVRTRKEISKCISTLAFRFGIPSNVGKIEEIYGNIDPEGFQELQKIGLLP